MLEGGGGGVPAVGTVSGVGGAATLLPGEGGGTGVDGVLLALCEWPPPEVSSQEVNKRPPIKTIPIF
ncbi:hypothetical protein [Bdellovibrio sp.]|uniref:hypothetical protein n=1 Tax=Bdellovibrio sp. TaxID=28201 RepID=UPI0039E4119E